MVAVTERAAQELREILTTHATDPEQLLRLTPGADGLSLMLDTEREEDEVVESEGTTILLVGPELSPTLAGTTIDCVDTTEGPRLTISQEEPTEEEQS